MRLRLSHLVVSDSVVTPWTIAHQTPLSTEFSRQEYWSGLLFPSKGDPPYPGIKPGTPALQTNSLQNAFTHRGILFASNKSHLIASFKHHFPSSPCIKAQCPSIQAFIGLTLLFTFHLISLPYSLLLVQMPPPQFNVSSHPSFFPSSFSPPLHCLLSSFLF